MITYTYTNGFICSNSATQNIHVDVCTGVQEFLSRLLSGSSFGLLVYPNPSNGQFTVFAKENTEVTVVDELGRIVYSAKLNASNNYSLEVSGLSKGFYFIRSTMGVQKVAVN